MKKLLMTLVASVAIAVSANAQVFVGGSVGFGSVKVAGGDSEVTYKIVPEVGYNFNKNWAIGLKIGYQKGACNSGCKHQSVHCSSLRTLHIRTL